MLDAERSRIVNFECSAIAGVLACNFVSFLDVGEDANIG
jgi:hypothetical protein